MRPSRSFRSQIWQDSYASKPIRLSLSQSRQGLRGSGVRSEIGGDRPRRRLIASHAGDRVLRHRRVVKQNATTAEISQKVAGAADATKLVVSVLSEVAGPPVGPASQTVEAAAAELRREVEGFLASVAA